MKKTLITIFLMLSFSMYNIKGQQNSVDLDEETSIDSVSLFGSPFKESFEKCLNIVSWNINGRGESDYIQEAILRISRWKDIDLWAFQDINNHLGPSFFNLFQSSHEIALSAPVENSNIFGLRALTNIGQAKSFDIRPISLKFKNLENQNLGLISEYKFSTGESFLLVNVQVLKFSTFSSFKNQLSKIFQEISKIDDPIIIIGDFSTWNKDRLKLLKLTMKENLFYDTSLFFNSNSRRDVRKRNPLLGRYINYFKAPSSHAFIRNLNIKDIQVLSNFEESENFPLFLKVCLPTFHYAYLQD